MQTHKNSRSREQQAMRTASRIPAHSIVDVDPEDPSQLLDEAGQFSVEELAVEAQPAEEAEEDLDLAVAMSAGDAELDEDERLFDSQVDEDAVELGTPSETYAESADDTGEGKDSELGETWLETLEKKAAEDGAEAEQDLVIIDDSDEHRGHSSSTARRDRPVADNGSGSGGL